MERTVDHGSGRRLAGRGCTTGSRQREGAERESRKAAAKAKAQAKVRGFPPLFLKVFLLGLCLSSRVSRRSIPRARPTRKPPKSTPDPPFPRRSTPRLRKLHIEVKQFRSLAPFTKSRLWGTKARGFPRACHEKSPPCTKMCTAPQRERNR